MQLVVSTRSHHKMREIREILGRPRRRLGHGNLLALEYTRDIPFDPTLLQVRGVETLWAQFRLDARRPRWDNGVFFIGVLRVRKR